MTNPQPTIDLHQYWDVLKARKLAVLVPTLAAIALAVLSGFVQTKQYTATARVLVNPLLSPVSTGTTAKANAPDMNTEQVTASSGPVGTLARSYLGLSGNKNVRLLGNLSVSAAPTGNILLFAYTSPDPNQAAKYANAFAKAYITYRNDTVLGPLQTAIKERTHTIQVLTQGLKGSGAAQQKVAQFQIREDEAQLATFQSDLSLVNGGQVIGVAVPPSSPSSPKIAKTAIIAAAAGLVLGIIIAIVREGMDRRIKSAAEFGARLDAPVLGIVPKFRGRGPERALPTITDPRGAAAEAFRMTGIALETMAIRTGARVIMITSPQGGGGTSTTAANIGVVLAQAGHQVILVSADLRRPTQHLIFDIPHGRGLSTALVEGKEAERLLKDTRIPNLFLLNAGPEPEDPAALLASPATAEIIATLQSLQPDFILLDTPAVLAASDAMILSRHADATVVTWNAENFHTPALGKARERLDRAGTPILGGIYAFDSGKSRTNTNFPRSEAPVAGAPRGPVAPPAGVRADAPFDPLDSGTMSAVHGRGSGRVRP